MTLDAEELFETSPFHRWLDCRIERMDGTAVVLRVPFREEFVGDPERRLCHGGVLSALADAAGTFALIAATGEDWVTVDLRIEFHRPAGPTSLTARARPVSVGRSIGFAEVLLTDESGRTVASGRLTLAPARAPADHQTEDGESR